MRMEIAIRRTMRVFAALAMTAVLTATTSAVAVADSTTDDYQIVMSQAGIPALQIAPAGVSAAEAEQAIKDYQATQTSQSTNRAAPEFGPLATGQYYSYCQEGTGAMMVWTNNSPKYCYGWYYEYLDGNRISKVNMLKLKAFNASLNPASEVRLKEWCDSNGFYCSLVFAAIPYVGSYLRKLLV